MNIDVMNIIDYQKSNCLTGRDLSKAIGISDRSLSRIKRDGRCNPATARMIARALGIPLDKIMLNNSTREGKD